MVYGGMVDDAMAQQRPILHQAEHGIPLSKRRRMRPENFSGACALSHLTGVPRQSGLRLATVPDRAMVSLRAN